jgi:hypothetical protein
LFALQQLAEIWSIEVIRAVGDANHIYRHFRKRRSFAFSYDEFWIECGGKPGRDSNFTLPAKPQLRPLSEIKAGKRSMYRRRYAMLEDLTEGIRERLLPVDSARAECPNGFGPKTLSPLAVAAARVSEWYI